MHSHEFKSGQTRMVGNNIQKLTALTFSCSSNAVEFLSGKGGILESHQLFGGMTKSIFLRLALIHTLKNPPTKAQLLDILKYTNTTVAFDSFCNEGTILAFNGGKRK